MVYCPAVIITRPLNYAMKVGHCWNERHIKMSMASKHKGGGKMSEYVKAGRKT